MAARPLFSTEAGMEAIPASELEDIEYLLNEIVVVGKTDIDQLSSSLATDLRDLERVSFRLINLLYSKSGPRL